MAWRKATDDDETKDAMVYNIGEQYEMAEAHCQTHGKTAEEVPDDQPDGLHTFTSPRLPHRIIENVITNARRRLMPSRP